MSGASRFCVCQGLGMWMPWSLQIGLKISAFGSCCLLKGDAKMIPLGCAGLKHATVNSTHSNNGMHPPQCTPRPFAHGRCVHESMPSETQTIV